MKCDIETLQQCLEGALAPEVQQSVREHLSSCGACRRQWEALEQNRAAVDRCLGLLDPPPGEVPEAADALACFQERLATPVPGRRLVTEASPLAGWRVWFYGWRRAWALGAVSVLCLSALLSSASVRQAAVQWLSLFRVRTFAVIPVDPAQLENLAGIEDLVHGGFLGEPEILRPGDGPREMSNLEDASAAAGYRVRSPSAAPAGLTFDRLEVEEGPAARYEIQRSMIQAVLATAGINNVPLPPDNTLVLEADLPVSVLQRYRGARGELEIRQMPSPDLRITPAVDPALLGRIALRLLGMPPADCERLASRLDWTSTLLIPLPTSIGQFREITVDGGTGILIEVTGANTRPSQAKHAPAGGERPGVGPERALLWQRDGMIYLVSARGVRAQELLRVADSLR